MLFLSAKEIENWRRLGEDILHNRSLPSNFMDSIRPNLQPVFHFYMGTLLAATGAGDKAREWVESGVMAETAGLFSNAYLAGFLQRHDGKLEMPAVAFADPRPYVHFTTVPLMVESRQNFIKCCGESLPVFNHPLRIMDIGCGNGTLLANLLQHLRSIGRINEVEEVLFIDQFPAMIELAIEAVSGFLPPSAIRTVVGKFEDVVEKIDSRFDVALSSLAYHHMPLEQKEKYLKKLKPRIDHFILFELDANNDTPEMYSPELALSVYQSYGRMIDFIFAHDAPVELALSCVDCFMMTEAVSLLSQPRGQRTEYHMLRTQWTHLFENTLGPEFRCLCDATCFGDQYFNLFALHYGKDGNLLFGVSV